MPSRSKLPRLLRTLVCSLAATAIGVGVAVPATVLTATAAHADPPRLTITSVTPGDGSVTITFTDENGSLSGGESYQAGCQPTGGAGIGGQSPELPQTNEAAVVDLTNFAPYTCTVWVLDSGENKTNESAPSAVVTPGVAPGQPTNVSGTPASETSITVLFTPAADGAPVNQFVAGCLDSQNNPFIEMGNSSPITVTGLTSPETYTCYVQPVNDWGNGNTSDPSDPIPLGVAAPDKPTSVQATGYDAVAEVTFTAPAHDNNSAITSYTATCTGDAGGRTGTKTRPNSPIIVTGLDYGNHYTCTVHATNAIGNSAESDPSNDIVPANDLGDSPDATAPEPPTITGVTPRSGQLIVAFTPGDDGGAAVTGYDASCTSDEGGDPGGNPGASSPITVDALTNNAAYTCTVIAINSVSDSLPSAPSDPATPFVDVPQAPPKPTVVAGNSAATVSFVAPDYDGGTAISSYDASCISSNGGADSSNSGSASPITVVGLTNGKTYTCTVTATNGIGESQDSPLSDAFSPIAATVPDPPTDVNVTRVSPASASVTFTDGSDNGSPVTGYRVECTSTDGGTPQSNTGTTLPIVVTSLTIGNTYTCAGFAINDEGTSLGSDPSDPFVAASVPSVPAAPTALQVSASDSITVTFDAPADNGDEIIDYFARCLSSDGGDSGSQGGLTSPIEVTDLTPGKTYKCDVVAYNNLGNSGWGADSDPIVLTFSAPDPPTFDAVNGLNGGLRISIFPPADHGSAITGYDASCTSDDGGVPGTAHATSTPFDVTNLTPGKTYTCTVTATNAAGTSEPSDASDPTLAAGVPDIPGQPTVDALHSAAAVSGAAGNDNGAFIDKHWAICTSNDGGTTQTAERSHLPVIVSGLTDGKTYTCQQRDHNAAGYSEHLSIPSDDFVASDGDGAPEPVFDVSASPNYNDGLISVDFDDLAPGAGVTGYTVTCESTNGGVTMTANGTDAPIAVYGGTGGAFYNCTVVSHGVDHDSAVSLPSNTVTFNAIPGAPTLTDVARIDSETQAVSFTPGVNNGTPVTAYTVECTSGDGGDPTLDNGASSPIAAHAFTPGKHYVCSVTATNDAGTSGSGTSAAFVAGDPPQPGGKLSVTGTLIAQRKLIAHNSGWTGAPIPTVTRHWQRCDANLSGCTNIAGATGTSYTLTNADVDKRIRFVDHAANGVGNSTRRVNTGIVHTVPVSTTGPYYYVSGGSAVKAPAGTVGATSHGNTVWRATANGNVYGPHFGPGNGTLTNIKLKKPIVGIVATTSGRGYWMFAADGGIFTFGDAQFYGSTGNLRLKAPIISMTAMPNGKGYWLFASDGGVFTFGGARFYGSTGAQKLISPVVAMLSTQTGKGYWLITKDGRAIRFGDAANIGRVTNHSDVVGVVSTGSGYRFITARGQLVVPH